MKDIIRNFSTTRFILIIVILAVIILNFVNVSVSDTLNTIVIAIVSFYFWKTVSSSQVLPEEPTPINTNPK